MIGDPNPDFIYGLTSNMSWKNFELSFFIQGSQGNDIYSFSMITQNYKTYLGYNALEEVFIIIGHPIIRMQNIRL